MNSSRFVPFALATWLAACSSPADEPFQNNATANNLETNNVEGNNNDIVARVTFSNIRIDELSATRAVARFDTSIPTDCEAEFGLSEDALDQRATDPSMEEGELSADHEVPLEDLEPQTEYFWRARAQTEDGEVFYSDVQTFTTLSDETELPPLQNFALDAVVMEVSSNFGGADNDSTWGASNAFDGQMATEWATNGDGDDAMLRVDLGSERKITHFAFRSREMADGTSIIEKVQLTFGDAATMGPFDTPDPDQRYVFELEMPQAASTVLIEAVQTTGGNSGAREIEFLGTPKE